MEEKEMTSISVSKDTALTLLKLKEEIGETYEDVIIRILKKK